MSRIIQDLKNIWGSTGGIEPQRSDLWQLNLDEVVESLNDILSEQFQPIARFYTSSLTLPDQAVTAETVRRDSRPFQMPSWDAPLDPMRVQFFLDATGNLARTSNLYRVLEAWRRVVRAGRGAMGSERELTLNDDYRIDYAFNLGLVLLKGGSIRPAQASTAQAGQLQPVNALTGLPMLNVLQTNNAGMNAALVAPAQTTPSTKPDFDITALFTLEKCWLAGMKLAELNYAATQVLMLETTIYVENIVEHSTK